MCMNLSTISTNIRLRGDNMSMSIDEILNKRIVGGVTYTTLLKEYLGEKYEQELPRIKQMTYENFLEYFENEVERIK